MITRQHYFDAIVKMNEPRADLESVLRELRVSRLKLGSILEQLENFEPGPAAIEQMHTCCDSIADEIDHLGDTIRQLMSK